MFTCKISCEILLANMYNKCRKVELKYRQRKKHLEGNKGVICFCWYYIDKQNEIVKTLLY